MTKKNKRSLGHQLRSFRYAFRGICSFFRSEFKAWIHLSAAVAAIAFGIILNVSATEWIFIALAIGLVFIAEILNTSIEKLLDLVHPEHNEKAGEIKDMLAGAVLVSSLIALLIGLIIFIPKLYNLIR